MSRLCCSTPFFRRRKTRRTAKSLSRRLRGLVTPASSAQVFVFLARYYSFQKSLQLLLNNLLYANSETALEALAHILHSDHAYMTDGDLDALESELDQAMERERKNLPKGRAIEV